MLEVTGTAQQKIAEYFQDKEVKPIRIFLNQGGWGGPSLAMALDEPQNNDEVYTIDGFQYLIEKDFLEKAKPVKVDFMGMGFQISSSIELGGGGGGCAGCGSSEESSSCGGSA